MPEIRKSRTPETPEKCSRSSGELHELGFLAAKAKAEGKEQKEIGVVWIFSLLPSKDEARIAG